MSVLPDDGAKAGRSHAEIGPVTLDKPVEVPYACCQMQLLCKSGCIAGSARLNHPGESGMSRESSQLGVAGADEAGLLISGLCAVHCAVLPFLLLLAPTVGLVLTQPVVH